MDIQALKKRWKPETVVADATNLHGGGLGLVVSQSHGDSSIAHVKVRWYGAERPFTVSYVLHNIEEELVFFEDKEYFKQYLEDLGIEETFELS